MTSKITVRDRGGIGFGGPSNIGLDSSSLYILGSRLGYVEISMYQGTEHILDFDEVEAVRDFLNEWMLANWPQDD
jgi:hypothetical protein